MTEGKIQHFKTCALFTNCISEINNKEIDYAKGIHVVMPMYNLIGYSDNFSKSLWQYYSDEPFIIDNGAMTDVLDDPESALFKYKQKITVQTENVGTKYVQIMVPLKYLSKWFFENCWNVIN